MCFNATERGMGLPHYCRIPPCGGSWSSLKYCVSCLFHDVCMKILCTRYRIWQNKYYRRVVQDHTMWGQLPKYKPESAINIGLLSFLDIVQGREGENAKRSLREISNYARVTKACSSHHQSDIWIIFVLHQNDGRLKC